MKSILAFTLLVLIAQHVNYGLGDAEAEQDVNIFRGQAIQSADLKARIAREAVAKNDQKAPEKKENENKPKKSKKGKKGKKLGKRGKNGAGKKGKNGKKENENKPKKSKKGKKGKKLGK